MQSSNTTGPITKRSVFSLPTKRLNYRSLDFEAEVLECPWECRGCLRRSTSCGCPEGFPAWLDSDVGQARQAQLGRYTCLAGPSVCSFCKRGPGHLILLGEWARDMQVWEETRCLFVGSVYTRIDCRVSVI